MGKKKNKTKTKVVEKIVEVPVSVPEDKQSIAYQAMDQADEMAILESHGESFADLGEALVYEFQSDGKTVTGLSWVGTKEAAIALANKGKMVLTTEELTWEPDEDDREYMIFKAKVKDMVSGRIAFGVKRQWKKTLLKGGKTVPNKFWLEQGQAKAKRNAMQELMPVSFLKKLITQWIKGGKSKQLAATTAPTPNAQEAARLTKVFQNIELCKTKEEVDNLEKRIVSHNQTLEKEDQLTGREMYLVRQALQNKKSKLK